MDLEGDKRTVLASHQGTQAMHPYSGHMPTHQTAPSQQQREMHSQLLQSPHASVQSNSMGMAASQEGYPAESQASPVEGGDPSSHSSSMLLNQPASMSMSMMGQQKMTPSVSSLDAMSPPQYGGGMSMNQGQSASIPGPYSSASLEGQPIPAQMRDSVVWLPRNTEDIKQFWSDQALFYTSHYEPCTLSLARTLIQALQLRDTSRKVPLANSVLEVGGASGAAAVELTTQLAQNSKYTVTDVCPEFVLFAETRLKFFPNVQVAICDGEHLPFPDQSFDRYVSNLTLNFVVDPDRMLREAYRVLTPGGIAAFSVWGRENFSYMHTIIPRVLLQLGIDLDLISSPGPNRPAVRRRSPFHLGKDVAELRERVLRVGFRTVCLFYQPMVMDVLDGECFADRMLGSDPQLTKLAQMIAPDRWKRVKEGIATVADTLLSCGIPISLDALVIIARK